MKEPRCIRYFSSLVKAEFAKELITSEGFEAEVKEDTFGTVSLDRYGLPLRFRLYVEMNAINPIAEILAKKIKK